VIVIVCKYLDILFDITVVQSVYELRRVCSVICNERTSFFVR